MSRPRKLAATLALASISSLFVLPAVPAAAEPGTPVTYPAGAASTHFRGAAFDTCTAPSRSVMAAWRKSSPYRAIGIYIGGFRACSQPQLTASWVSEVSKQGWRLLPIYVGRQAPCTADRNDPAINPSQAAAQGVSAARDAVTNAKSLGILPGSALYTDMEHYNAGNSSCRTTVLRFLSGWTKELHRHGYLSGVYAHINSGARHLAEVYGSRNYARPDALWIARWDGSTSLANWPRVSNNLWSNRQRAKQYTGNVRESHGGVRLNIDHDSLDTPVATVAYGYRTTTGLNARRGPSTAYPVVRKYAGGAAVKVVCQTAGQRVKGTPVWDKLADGTYVSDYYVTTPSKTTYSNPLPRCSYPYQVSAVGGLNMRAGPGTSHAKKGALGPGALAWVVCQHTGTKVGTTTVWNRLDTGVWVSDYYVTTPSKTTFSAPIPRC